MNEIPKWFIGSRLNYAQNILDKYHDDRVAIIFSGEESGVNMQYTYKELKEYVEKVAAGLKAENIKSGDVIVAYVPNCPEAVF